MNIQAKNIAIIGSSGAIGKAFTNLLTKKYPHANIYSFSQNNQRYNINYSNEKSINSAANIASEKGLLDLVVVANGILHNNEVMPEKSLKELSKIKFNYLFNANVVIPALIAKYFLPKLNRDNTAKFAMLSAKVGSITDNQIGGWYSYRASKAALNMIIKNASIEIARRNQKAIIVGLHPGTVDSNLSKPFKHSISINKVFTPEYSVSKLLTVLEDLTPDQSGKCFAWNGEEIKP